ncbi:DUF3021 domain-containing protein [Clostridium perfringens]|uniref:DUF3021 domain-containing protein n=1 Tax=Clostridium perfringens TaxID=1502 RepID=UPI001ABA166C|nr:DUF3021 domain-containing protein [Clostridium perfringens]MBO3342063.1 DUF3021 domain-containing protein [Clostridium perfringens]MDK0844284.1 DUF3021 domain-containing protein [Clostridium perfringens]
MKRFLVHFIRRFFIGAALGVFINQIIFLLIAKNICGDFMINFNLLLKQFLPSCIVGGVSVGLSAIYDFENINFLAKTLVHFLVGILVYLLVGSYVGWFSINIGTILGSIAIYFGIWIIFYFIEKKRIQEINKALKNKK